VAKHGENIAKTSAAWRGEMACGNEMAKNGSEAKSKRHQLMAKWRNGINRSEKMAWHNGNGGISNNQWRIIISIIISSKWLAASNGAQRNGNISVSSSENNGV
jgi:hypothetical protein